MNILEAQKVNSETNTNEAMKRADLDYSSGYSIRILESAHIISIFFSCWYLDFVEVDTDCLNVPQFKTNLNRHVKYYCNEDLSGEWFPCQLHLNMGESEDKPSQYLPLQREANNCKQ